jgi:serine O-acetyltransferase
MIKTKSDLLFYLNSDKNALGIKSNSYLSIAKLIIYPNQVLKFQRLLRKCEYHKNNRKSLYHLLLFAIYYRNFHQLSAKLGFSIPLNVFGPGLSIVHYGTIVVSPNAKVGANCRIHPSTCIGASGGKPEAPTIGDNVYIGPGAKIYGGIELANNIAIGANAAVNKSFLEEGILIAGVPAKKIKEVDITTIIKHLKS